MAGSLFESVIFGPVKSRRLGTSLGINLMPTTKKICSFNCIYCECGWTNNTDENYDGILSVEDFKTFLETQLQKMTINNDSLDAITFAGNGEPTLHSNFLQIIKATRELRDKYYPKVSICVLSNSTTLNNINVVEGLRLCDKPILKLDAGSEKTFLQINKPRKSILFAEVIKNLQNLDFPITIQSLFLRGNLEDENIDNSTNEEITAWLAQLKLIKPKHVMIYSLDRVTPASSLQKLSYNELNDIAKRVQAIGFKASVYS